MKPVIKMVKESKSPEKLWESKHTTYLTKDSKENSCPAILYLKIHHEGCTGVTCFQYKTVSLPVFPQQLQWGGFRK